MKGENMELKEIQKGINKLKEEQDRKLEQAYRDDERIKTLKYVRHEMIMFEHSISNFQSRWNELKDLIERCCKTD